MNIRTTWFSCTVLACAASGSWCEASGQTGADATRLKRDIETLAHDRWEGRATCAPGNDSAAAYIAKRFADLGLAPAGSRDSASGRATFLHRYVARPSGGQAHYGITSCIAYNVAGIVRGTDPALAGEYVIIGAHFDHLGRNTINALDPQSLDSIRNGADDNASGTAGVMELARLFRANPGKRSLVFVTFSGEEMGTLGSQEFAARALPDGRMQAMVNFDMIGRLRGDTLFVFGTGTATEMRDVVERANTGAPLLLRTNPDGYGPSDHSEFYGKKIPVLHFFTGTHDDYHKASDESAKINAAGEARVLDYAARVIRDLADRAALTLIELPPPAPSAAGSGTRPYLGTIPDMAAGDVPGLRINGVTPGSPADKGGLQAGDLVVEFDGASVTDIQTYSVALNAHKPGDTVRIIVLRGGTRVTVTVTLGRRAN